MKKMIIPILFILGLVGYAESFENTEKGIAAKKLVNDAIDFFNETGYEEAMIEFTNRDGKFVIGDLYIFVLKLDGDTVAHGGNSSLVGKNLLDIRDPDGKYFMKEFIEVANDNNEGWVEYKWSNPNTNTIQKKVAYVKKPENTDLVFGCGYYE